MAGIGDGWDQMKDFAEEANAEEPAEDHGGPATDVDEEAILARAKRQLGWQVTNPSSYETAPAVQASRAGTNPSGTVTDPSEGTVASYQRPSERKEAVPDVDENETVARAKRQLGL